MLESGAAKLSTREIPVTLHDSLMARLDRLGSAKDVLQVGAVIGGEFSYELLRAVHGSSEQELENALRKLTDAELLYFRGMTPDASYQFKHALIRDAAYEALLKSRRKELHRLVAHIIDEQFTDMKEAHPEVLARHWTEAGEIDPAIEEWSKAGKTAEARTAFHEAQESLQQALGLLNSVPESRERDARELALRQSLVHVLRLTRGWVAPETIEAAARIGPLAEKSGELRKLVGALQTRSFHASLAGDLSIAASLADEALELARREGNPSRIAFVQTTQEVVHFYRGDFTEAEKYFSEAVKFVDDPIFRRNPTGISISVLGWASWTAWMLGRADVARERLAKMMATINSANPHDLAWSNLLAAILYVFMRENESAETLAARALQLSEEHRFPVEAIHSRYILGHAQVRLGRPTDSIALIRAGIDALPSAGDRVSAPINMAYLAAAQFRAGAVDDALQTVEEALDLIPERTYGRPEIFRVRGEIRLALEDFELAEADLRQSIDMARGMAAKAWELRTTMSLAGLLAHQRRRDEARIALAEIYGWFTEGFNTPDLKEAKLLLEELGGTAVSPARVLN